MTDQFMAEIRLMPYNFAPSGWAFCNGQLLPIAQNTALFSLLGTTYGGDGRSTFALPNLQGRVPLGWGQGPGMSDRVLGEVGGVDRVTLLNSEIPAHNHALLANTEQANLRGAAPERSLAASVQGSAYSSTSPNVSMTPTGVAGGDGAHNNLQPYLVLSYCIALVGIFPPR